MGIDGDDVTMNNVCDMEKRLKTNSEFDGGCNPLTVAEVGCDQPRERH